MAWTVYRPPTQDGLLQAGVLWPMDESGSGCSLTMFRWLPNGRGPRLASPPQLGEWLPVGVVGVVGVVSEGGTGRDGIPKEERKR
jgi:hypothetical protein